MLKKISLSLILLSSTIYANTIQLLAEKYYNAGEYSSALKSAEKSIDEYSNPQLHLIWAKSAKALGMTEESMAAFERVLILDPQHNEAKRELMLIYKESGREVLLNYQEGIPSNENTLKIRMDFSTGYDNNLNANPGGEVFDDYYGVVGSQGGISSAFMKITSAIDYIYYLPKSPDWFIKAKMDLYYQNNTNAHLYDMFIGTSTIGVGYKSDQYQFYLPISYSYINYLDTHLLNRYLFSPYYLASLDEQSYIGIQGIYSKGLFTDETYSNRDSRTIGAKIDYYYLLSTKTRLKTYIKYESRENNKESDERYINADFYSLGATIKYNFTDTLNINLDTLYRYGKYEDDIGIDTLPSTELREDSFYQINLKLSYLYQKDLEYYIYNQYGIVTSNYILAEYHKNKLIFGITTNF